MKTQRFRLYKRISFFVLKVNFQREQKKLSIAIYILKNGMIIPIKRSTDVIKTAEKLSTRKLAL